MDKLTVKVLRERLSKKGLDTHGRKAELIARLEEVEGDQIDAKETSDEVITSEETDASLKDTKPSEVVAEEDELAKTKVSPPTATVPTENETETESIKVAEKEVEAENQEKSDVQEEDTNGSNNETGQDKKEETGTNTALAAALAAANEIQPTTENPAAATNGTKPVSYINPETYMANAPAAPDHERHERKIFVAGIFFGATDEEVYHFFSKFGKIEDCKVVRDRVTNQSKGFGFISFEDVRVARSLIAGNHPLIVQNPEALKFMERILTVKSSTPPGHHKPPASNYSNYSNAASGGGGGGAPAVGSSDRKIFVGGLRDHILENDLLEVFAQYGRIDACNIVRDGQTGRCKGYGFVTFSEDALGAPQRAIASRFVQIKDLTCNVSTATPPRNNQNNNHNRGMYNGGGYGTQQYGGGYAGGYNAGGYAQQYGYGGGARYPPASGYGYTQHAAQYGHMPPYGSMYSYGGGGAAAAAARQSYGVHSYSSGATQQQQQQPGAQKATGDAPPMHGASYGTAATGTQKSTNSATHTAPPSYGVPAASSYQAGYPPQGKPATNNATGTAPTSAVNTQAYVAAPQGYAANAAYYGGAYGSVPYGQQQTSASGGTAGPVRTATNTMRRTPY